MGELTFNAERHEYRLDGRLIPSVTTIISAIGLYDFDFVSEDTLETAALRGTYVHQYVEWYERGTLDETSIDPELSGYFRSYLAAKARALIPATPCGIEQRIFSRKYWYAGTLDQLFADGWVNDIKSGAPGPEHGLQLTAYWLAMHDGDLNVKPKRLTCTYLHRDGTLAEVTDYPYEPLEWIAALTNYRWRERNNKIRRRFK